MNIGQVAVLKVEDARALDNVVLHRVPHQMMKERMRIERRDWDSAAGLALVLVAYFALGVLA
jgi:hypothetical protein